MVCPTGVKQCAVSFRTAMQRYYANGGESKEESPSQVSFSFHSVYQAIAMAKESMMEISADGEVCTEVERTMATVKAKRVKKQE